LSEPLAATNLADTVTSLQNQGVSIFTYPLTVQLFRIRQPIGAFQFAINGPPGVYTVLGSTNLAGWSELSIVTNNLGNVVFTDGTAISLLRNFIVPVLNRSKPSALYDNNHILYQTMRAQVRPDQWGFSATTRWEPHGGV